MLAGRRGGRLLFYEEDTGGTVAVLEQAAGRASFRRLYVQGVSNSGDAPASLRYMRLQALLPWARPSRRAALRAGRWASAPGSPRERSSPAPGLETRVVVELLPAVVRAGPLFAGNLGAAADSRLEIHGSATAGRSSCGVLGRYDVITLEPPPPSAAGVVNLYSRDFYELAREPPRAGRPAGSVVAAAHAERRGLALARPQLPRRVPPCQLPGRTELHEVLLVGSREPRRARRANASSDRLRQGDVATALAEVGVESAASLLATWLTGREGLERYAGDAPPVTDDRPRIEHAAWVRRGRDPNACSLACSPLGHRRARCDATRPAAHRGRGRASRAARVLPLLPRASWPGSAAAAGCRPARSAGPGPWEPLLPLGGLRGFDSRRAGKRSAASVA